LVLKVHLDKMASLPLKFPKQHLNSKFDWPW